MNEYMHYVYITYTFMMHVWCMHYDVCVCMCVYVCVYTHTLFLFCFFQNGVYLCATKLAVLEIALYTRLASTH